MQVGDRLAKTAERAHDRAPASALDCAAVLSAEPRMLLVLALDVISATLAGVAARRAVEPLLVISPMSCRRLSALGLSFALLVVGCNKEVPQQQQAGAMPPAQVTVVTLKAETVTLTRELPGRTSPFVIAEVRPQVSGIIKQRLFTEGAVVKAGQALYQLDDATYRADYATAEAALARAKVTLDAARLRAQRTDELAKSNLSSVQEVETVTAAYRQAEADAKAAQAALQRAAVILGYCRITSPITGRIGKSSVTQGALVTANQPQALATVQQLDPIYVDLTQSSSELLQLRKELEAGTLQRGSTLPVTILLEDGTKYPHAGTLAFADVTVDPGTGSFALRVQVPNPDNVLLPGMYVRAIVSNGVRENGVLVPQRAIARDPKGNASAMVVKDGKVEARIVQTNRTVGDSWLVDSGLAAGDQVIIEGLQKIGPGMPVQASEAPAASGAPPSGTAPASTAASAEPASSAAPGSSAAPASKAGSGSAPASSAASGTGSK